MEEKMTFKLFSDVGMGELFMSRLIHFQDHILSGLYTKRGYAAEITMTTSNIDEIYGVASTHLKEHIVRDLKEKKDHGHIWKDFRMVDPFGFYLRFTELIDWGQK